MQSSNFMPFHTVLCWMDGGTRGNSPRFWKLIKPWVSRALEAKQPSPQARKVLGGDGYPWKDNLLSFHGS